jgi:hypothetical protein
VEKHVIAGYLLQLRSLLQKSQKLTDTVAAQDKAIEAKPHLIEAMELAELVKPGTEHLLDKAVETLLDELEQQRKASPSLYLVSCETGMSVMPIGEKDIYYPPKYRGMDGNMHEAKPIVHPGITSSLAIAAHESEKERALLALSGNEIAFAHLSDPDKIVEIAKQKLTNIVSFCQMDGPWHEIKFGKENAAGMEQSANLAFHRVELFSSILAKRIVSLCGKGGRCQIGKIVKGSSSKQRWYVVSVKLDPVDASCVDKNFSQN